MTTIFTFIGEDTEVIVTCTYYPGDPGQTSGPPERCWPPEAPELEIEKVMLGPFDIPQYLSEADMEELCDRLMECVAQEHEYETKAMYEEYLSSKAEEQLLDARDIDYWERRMP